MTAAKKCPACRAPMAVTEHAQYEYKESGLEGVFIECGVRTYECPECGETMVSIPAIEPLHRALALALANKSGKLTPAEVRFLRSYLGLTNEEFAATMGVRPETSSKWASGKEAISALGDRLLRMLVAHRDQLPDYGAEQLRGIADEVPPPKRIALRKRSNRWEAVTAA